jgi:hypothetical protein
MTNPITPIADCLQYLHRNKKKQKKLAKLSRLLKQN